MDYKTFWQTNKLVIHKQSNSSVNGWMNHSEASSIKVLKRSIFGFTFETQNKIRSAIIAFADEKTNIPWEIDQLTEVKIISVEDITSVGCILPFSMSIERTELT